MDLNLVKLGMEYTRRRKKWVLLLAAFGFSGYGAYRVYHSPSLVKKRARLFKLLGALITIAEAVSDSAETIGFISKDLRAFLQSESDGIPNSLKQFSKITASDEFSETMIRVTRALTAGLLRGYQTGTKTSKDKIHGPSFTDQVMDKVFSPAGSGFASVVVGSFARNLVMALFSEIQLGGGSSSSKLTLISSDDSEDTPVPQWLDLACSQKCKELIGDCVQSFVSTAVTVYLEKTMDVNAFDEVFKGLTNPKHEAKVKDMFASICNGAVETLVRTSHDVITNSSKSGGSTRTRSYSVIDQGRVLKKIQEIEFGQGGSDTNYKAGKSRNLYSGSEDDGMAGKVFSTLTAPSNKNFILDLTGKVTFETVRSFLEFFLDKLCSSLKKTACVVHETIVDGGISAVRYVTVRSSVLMTLCLSLCLHILDSSWLLVTA